MKNDELVHKTEHGTYYYHEIDAPFRGTYIIIRSDVIEKLKKGEKIAENTIKLEDDILVDWYAMGNYKTYIEMLEITIGLREDD